MILLALTIMVVGFVVGVLMGRWSVHQEHAAAQAVVAADAKRTSTRALIEYRAAVHEAGHAVCAWFSPYTTSIKRITIDSGGTGTGRTLTQHRQSAQPEADWYLLVGHLGGLAAEMHEFGNVRSGPSGSDLVLAKDPMGRLVNAGALSAPWTGAVLPQDYFDVSTMYRSIEAGSDSAFVLNMSYQRARRLVDQDNGRLIEVAEALCEHGTIAEPEIKRIFGKRSLFGRLFR